MDVSDTLDGLYKRDAVAAGYEHTPTPAGTVDPAVVSAFLSKQSAGSKPPLYPGAPLAPVSDMTQKITTIALRPDRTPEQRATDMKYLGESLKKDKKAFKDTMSQGIAFLPKTGRARTLRNSTTGGDIASTLMCIRDQIKLYHWQTGRFSRHNSTDDLVGKLDELVDQFVEVFMGKYGRPKVSKSIKLHNFSEKAAEEFITKQTVYLTSVLPRKLKKSDTDLLNIRDEILAAVNQTRYLFTLT